MIPRLSCILLALVTATAARADVVRIRSADGSFGQGWLHVAQDGRCQVAMPAHVVPKSGTGIAMDATGREYEIGTAVHPDPEVDFALMTVPVPRGTICSASRLGSSDLQRRIANLQSAALAYIDAGERRTMPVQLVAAAVDASAGSILAFRPAMAGDHFQQGMSGSIILADDGTMIAMLTDVDPDSGIGIALRFDVIRRLAGQAPPVAGDAPAMAIVVETGMTADTAAPPSALARDGIWRVAPVGGRLSWVTVMETEAIVTGATFTLSCGGDRVTRATLSVRTDPANPFSSETVCAMAPSAKDAVAVTCRQPPRRARQIRLALTATGDAPACVGGFGIAAQ